MTHEELAELDAAFLANAHADTLAGEAGPFGSTIQRLRRIEQIRKKRDQPADQA